MIAQWPVDSLLKLPPRVITDIQSALDYGFGERGIQDVLSDLMKGQKQIWMHSTDDTFNATVVTQVIDYPNKRTCEVVYLGGDTITDFLDEIKDIEDWAAINGCKDMQVVGRKGWLRPLKKQGYTDRYTTIGKELTHRYTNDQ